MPLELKKKKDRIYPTLCAIPYILLKIFVETMPSVWVQLQEYEALKER